MGLSEYLRSDWRVVEVAIRKLGICECEVKDVKFEIKDW